MTGHSNLGWATASFRAALGLLVLVTAIASGRDHDEAQPRDPAPAARDTERVAPAAKRPRSMEAGKAMPVPIVNVDGLSNADNVAAGGSLVTPAFANGDIGASHYVQVTYQLVRVFDRAGVAVSAPFRMRSVFAALGAGHPCFAGDGFNPIVLYDHLADRWVLSQGVPLTLAPPFFQCVAVSKTSDPTAQWHAYAFLPPGGHLPDFSRFGLAKDAYLMTTTQFTSPSFTVAGVGLFAFERDRMLAGEPAPAMVYFDLNSRAPEIFRAWPADLDGPPPPTSRPALFAALASTEQGGSQDAVRLFELQPDFDQPMASTLIELPLLPVAAFDPIDPTGRADIPQPVTANRLDSAAGVGPWRVQYRHLGNAERLVLSHTVDVSGDTSASVYRAGLRTYVLDRALPGGSWSVLEQNTFGPADGVHRWIPSAATDRLGNLAIGYSASDATSAFPSLRHAGRLASDAPGVLAQGEATLHTGSASQTSTNRWGELSAMSVDPVDDCTYWYTNQYLSGAGTCANCWRTRIAAFRYPVCDGAAVMGVIQGRITRADGGAAAVGAQVSIPGGYRTSSEALGDYRARVYPGSHELGVTFPGYQPANASMVVVTAGASTTRDFVLLPVSAQIFVHGFEDP